MTVGFVAFHYPEPAYFEEFVERVHRVRDVLESAPGCLSVECWVTSEGDAVVSTGQWDSADAYAASFAAVARADVDVAFDERECRPRQIFTLSSR
ncbi:antibiotic biosynthesis monooxygenase [Nocardia sp. NPDC052566]|uniref:antibiotic biosynthesis monooxygenase n=1 Tax=Nocardia sp. NPDC052566 TaxID=3364330 RepID=UPI0037CC6454